MPTWALFLTTIVTQTDSEMLPFDDSEYDDALRIIEPYFKGEPSVEYGGLDYVGGTPYHSKKPQYWFVHKLSDTDGTD